MKFSAIFLTLILFFENQARAVLGEKNISIQNDIQSFRGTETVEQHSNYSIHNIQSENITVREFVGIDGNVFAVAWKGARHPDLSVLLGKHYRKYQDTSDSQKKGRRGFRRVTTPEIVVEKTGHMGSLRGRAYAPGLVPSGVSLDEIR